MRGKCLITRNKAVCESNTFIFGPIIVSLLKRAQNQSYVDVGEGKGLRADKSCS